MLSHLQGKPLMQEAENWQGDRVTKTFCYLKEIELKSMKIQQKTQLWVTNMQSRFIDKSRLFAKITPIFYHVHRINR